MGVTYGPKDLGGRVEASVVNSFLTPLCISCENSVSFRFFPDSPENVGAVFFVFGTQQPLAFSTRRILSCTNYFSAGHFFCLPSHHPRHSSSRNLSFPEPWKVQNAAYMILLTLAMADCTKGQTRDCRQAMWSLSQEFGIDGL